MVGWIEKIYEKRWIIGWIKNRKKQMDGQKKYNEKKMDGWMDKK